MGRIVWRWTEGELARWEAALRAAPASAVEVEEVLALLAEVRRLRAELAGDELVALDREATWQGTATLRDPRGPHARWLDAARNWSA